MRGPKLAQLAAAIVIGFGVAGCLTITLPQYGATSPDDVPVAAVAGAQDPAVVADAGTTVLATAGPVDPALGPLDALPAATDPATGLSMLPSHDVGAMPTVMPSPTPTTVPPAVPTVSPTPTAVPTAAPTPTPSPTPRPTVTPTASPTTVATYTSPHATGWRKQHGQVVTEAGGVDLATIASGISCATCHTTHRAPDGSIPKSPASNLTCYSCHNGPKGG